MGSTEGQIAAVKKKAGQLLAAAKSGADGQVEQLLELYRPYLLAVANKEIDPALQSKAGASDLVQETLWRVAASSPDQLPNDVSELREFLRKTLIRRIEAFRQQYRRTKKRQIRRERSLVDAEAREFLRTLCVPAEETPGSRAARRERVEQLRQAIEQLRAEYRQIIYWHNRDGLGWIDIGKKLDRSPDAVRMLWKRAISRLREMLDESDAKS